MKAATVALSLAALTTLHGVNAFAPLSVQPRCQERTQNHRCAMMIDPSEIVQTVEKLSSTSVLLAETEAWVQPASNFLDPFLNIMSFAMLTRVVLSWYPTTKVTEFPWIAVVLPTEPLLRAVKGVIPPAFGVDITPIFWLGVFTFIHEILLGQQGLLTLKLKYGI